MTAPDFKALLKQDLSGLKEDGRLRSLVDRRGSDFASNDYLGLASHPRLAGAIRRALDRGVPVGAGGSRLLRGNVDSQEAFEAEAAAFFGAEAAIGFGGGFVANQALFSTLPQRGDLLLMDELIHASAHEGARIGRAEVAMFRHNDAGDAEDKVRIYREAGGKGAVWIAVESLYSMDGDLAPLDDFASLADREGWLVIDEAHATGVFGPRGRGLSHHLEGRGNVVTLHTLGKALGGSGALLCGPAVIRDFIINRARPFIFATAPSPLMAEAGREALRILQDEPWHQSNLAARVAFVHAELEKRLPKLALSGSHILPLVLGDNHLAMQVAETLQRQGFDIRGIRPPTVPQGSARLRVSITLNPDDSEVGRLIDALEQVWPES